MQDSTDFIEKIAREAWEEITELSYALEESIADCEGDKRFIRILLKALAQARAPLVAVLRDVQGEIIAFIESDHPNSVLRKEAPLRIKQKVNDGLCAALTGTENK